MRVTFKIELNIYDGAFDGVLNMPLIIPLSLEKKQNEI